MAGVVAAVLISRGTAAPVAFAAGAGVGLGIGLANAVGVGLCGLPGPVVTFVVAEAAIWIAGSAVVERSVSVPELAFQGWLSWHSSPMLAVRVLVVALVYLSALLGLLMIDYAVWRGVKFPRRVSLFAAMAASGLLSGVGGVLWLLDNSRAPAPTRLIDDLRIPAAAILAGGLFLGRKGRELLAGMSLPVAMLIVTIWRQKTWNLPGLGLALQMLVMTGMTIAVHLAFGQYVAARGSRRKMPTISVLLTVSGITLVAAAANFDHRLVREVFHVAGIAVWLSGMPTLILAMRQEARLGAGSE